LIVPPYDELFVKYYHASKHTNYSCVEFTAIGAAWLHRLDKYPVISVSMANHDKSWGHTVLEVPNLGTYDFFINVFFPNYYWHERPINDNDLSKMTKAVSWDDNQKLHMIEEYFRYDPEIIKNRSAWTLTNIEVK